MLNPPNSTFSLPPLRGVCPERGVAAAAYDTRVEGPVLLTGHASKAIGARLERHGYRLVTTESFLVDKAHHLLAGEDDRARDWAAALRASVAASA